MKLTLCALLLSFSAFASEYTCRTGMIKLVLKPDGDMTTLLVQDLQSHEYYYNGVVADIFETNNRTDMMFETKSNAFLQLQFKSSELDQEADRLFGFAHGWYGAGFVDDSIQCMKNI